MRDLVAADYARAADHGAPERLSDGRGKKAFASEVDYAQLVKIYGAQDREKTVRYNPRAIRRSASGGNKRQPGPCAHLHVLRRPAESHDAHVDAPVYATDEWFFKEGGEPRARLGDSFRPLQFLPRASDAPRDASLRSGPRGSRLGSRRTDRSIGQT